MIPCPHCTLPLAVTTLGHLESAFCPACRRDVQYCAWPALERSVERARVARPAAAGEATCFGCGDKAATGVCAACGCFVCPACEAEWFGQSLCLSCIHTLREVKGDLRFSQRTVLYDNIALMALILPMVIIPFYGVMFAVLIAPFSLYLVIRHRKASRGLPPRGPFRLIAAGTLAGLLLLGALGLIGAMVYWMVNANSALSGYTEHRRSGKSDAALGGYPPGEVAR